MPSVYLLAEGTSTVGPHMVLAPATYTTMLDKKVTKAVVSFFAALCLFKLTVGQF
jgi:hypothetical protein